MLCFSNAVLHWITDKEKVIEKMYLCLKKGGRIVLEFGGKGNVEMIINELSLSFAKREHLKNINKSIWYFPSLAEYSIELEKKNFRIVSAEYLDRFTPLKGSQGLKNWCLMFGNDFFEEIPELEKEEILREVQNNLRQSHCIDNVWHADYKRIRIIALKQ